MNKPRQKRYASYAICACAFLFFGVGFWFYSTRNSIPELFEDLPAAEAPKTFPEAQYAKRFRWVKLNPVAFDRAFEVGGKLKLNFFGDRKYSTTIVGKQVHDQFNSTSAALLDDNPETMAIFSRGKESFYAVFTLSDMRQVVVSHAGGRAYSVAEIDPSSIGKCAPPADARKKSGSPKSSSRSAVEGGPVNGGVASAANPSDAPEARTSIEEVQRRLTPDQRALLDRILSSPEAGAKLTRALESPAKPAERMPTSVAVTASPISADLLMRGHREVAGTEVATPFLAQLTGYSLYGRTAQAAKVDPGSAAQVLYPRLGSTEYIDVLFLYTAAAQLTAGNAAAVYVRVNALVAQVNAIFARSRISMEIRAVNDPTQFSANRYLARSRYWEGSAAAAAAPGTALPEDYNTPVSSTIINGAAIGAIAGSGLAIPRSTLDNLTFNNRTTHIPEGIGAFANAGTYTGAQRKPSWTELVSYGLSALAAQSRPMGGGTPYALTDVRGLGLGNSEPEVWFARYVPNIVDFDSGGNLNFALDWLMNTPPVDPNAVANSWGMAGIDRSNSFIYGDQYWGLTTPWINHIHVNSWNDMFNWTAGLYANNVAAPSQTVLTAGYTWNLLPNTAAQAGPPSAGVNLLSPGPNALSFNAPSLVFASNPAGPVGNTQWQQVIGATIVTNFLTSANVLIGPAENTPAVSLTVPYVNAPAAVPIGVQGSGLFGGLWNVANHPYAAVYGDAVTSIVTDADQEYWNSDIFVGPTFDTRFYKQNVRGVTGSYYTTEIQSMTGPDTWAFVGNLRAPLRGATGGQLNTGAGWGADAYPYTAFTEINRNSGVWGQRIGGNADVPSYTRAFITGFTFTANPNNIFVNKVAHGYVVGQQITVVNGIGAPALAPGVLNGTTTRVVTATADWFTLANPGVGVGTTGTFETGNPWLTVNTPTAHALQTGNVVRICNATDTTISGVVIPGLGLGRLYEIQRIDANNFRVINPTPNNNATGTMPNGVDPMMVLHGTTAFNTPTLAAATAANTLAADMPSASGVFRVQFLNNPATTGQYTGAVGLRMDTLNALDAHTNARHPLLHTETLIDEKPDVIVLLDTSSGLTINLTGLSYQFERRYRTYNAVTNQNYIGAATHALHEYPANGLCQDNPTACATMWRDNRFACAVDLVQAALNYSLAHEFGHILGCSHGYGDLGLMPDDDTVVFTQSFTANPSSRPTTPDTFNSMGVHIIGDDGNYYHSIMAYQRTASSLRIPYFSSPSLYYKGRQLNRSSDVLTSGGASASNCDNAQCISIVGSVIARYRDANGTGRSSPTFVAGSIPGSGTLPRTNQPLPDLTKVGGVPVAYGVAAAKGSTGTGSVPDASKAGSTKTGAGKTATTTPSAIQTTATGGVAPTVSAVKPAASSTGATSVTASRPPNDDIARAIMIQGANRTVRGENKGATPEPWETPYTTAFQGKSVWWYWDAMTEGRVTIKTEGSNFDTKLLVFMYANGKFLPVGLNDNVGNGASWSQMTVPLRKSTRYYIGVDGAGGAEGQVVLNVEQSVPAASPAKSTTVAPKTTKQKVRSTAEVVSPTK